LLKEIVGGMFPTIRPGMAMIVKGMGTGEACIIITGPFLLVAMLIITNL
jgi:hypothetical protein